jgi:transposase
MRSNGTAKELEARRRLAVQRVEDGWTQREVAAFLGVHPVTVAKWMARFRDQGAGGLAAKPTPGRPRFLTADQEKQVLGWLADPPTKHGFRTDLWTARRVAELIRTRLKVAFHPHYLREWLRKRNYTPQKPARRAKQQNPAEIDRWLREEWPRIEKKSQPTTPTSS